MRLKDKVALITGAGKGIGKAIATKFAQEGCAVAVNDIKVSYANNVAEGIDIRQEKAIALPGDVSRRSDVAEMLRKTVQKFGRIDIVVNSAGIRANAPFHRLTEEDWESTLSTNLKGSFNCAQAAERHMVERNSGQIIFLASPVPPGLVGKGQAHYCAANAGIEGLTKALAAELGPFHIRVNCIVPEFIDTDMTRETAQSAGMYMDDFKKLVVAQIPLRRMGDPMEVANLAAFLASEESSFITGQVIRITGGL